MKTPLRSHERRVMIRLSTILLLLALSPTIATAELAGEWWEDFDRIAAGTDGWVLSSCMISSEITVVAGDFDHVGELPVSNIFEAHNLDEFDDHRTWCEPMGEGLDGRVYAVVYYDGEIIAGGDFSGHLARWADEEWTTLGTWDDTVRSLHVADGLLYIGGDFSERVKAWDGSSWIDRDNPPLGSVRTLTIYDGQLAAGGYPGDNICLWNGISWDYLYLYSFFDGGDFVNDLHVFQGQLYAGGYFHGYVAGGTDVRNFASWDGSAWQAIAEAPIGMVNALLSGTDNSGYPVLWVGGEFSGNGGDLHDNLGNWDGDSWADSYQLYGTDGPVYSLTGSGALTVIGGSFDHYGDYRSGNVLKSLPFWGQFRFFGWVGEGLSGPAWTLGEHAGALCIGGQFWGAGDELIRGVARWDAGSWAPFDQGRAYVSDLHDFAGELFAAGGTSVSRWDGANWSLVGETFGGGWPVRTLTDYDGTLHAGGAFTEYDGAEGYLRVARWEDPSWVPLGGGIEGADFPQVNALAVHDGDLYVGGRFDTAGGRPAANIVRWDGSVWHALGDGLDDTVEELYSDGDRLVAVGSFDQAGGMPAARVAAWQGGAWIPLGDNVTGTVRAITRLAGQLIIAGSLSLSDDPSAMGLAAWSEGTWLAVDADAPQQIYAMRAQGQQLWITGTFTSVGDTPSQHVAVFEALPTGVAEGGSSMRPLVLKPVYPNPFNPHTTISFTLGVDGPVRLSIHDVQGRRLRVVLDHALSAGNHDVTWDGRGESGRELPSGVYFARLEAAGDILGSKLVLSR
jgi:hypothetical protein